MTRVRMIRSIGRRLDLIEGRVCDVSADDAGRFIAAGLAEPVADDAEAMTAEPTADDTGTPPKTPRRKPKPETAAE